MVHRYLFWLLAALLLAGPARAQTQAPLQAGDIALLGFDATDPDDFAFTPLVDLAPGTQLKFTDNGWLPTGGFRLTEGICVYTAPAAGVARGTVVSFRADSAAFTHPGRFLLATDGDQLLVYQGPESAPTFLYGLAFKNTWSNVVSANTSALPPGLTAGSSALSLPFVNGNYLADSPRSGTVAALRAALGSTSNWTGSSKLRVSWPTTALQVLPTRLAAPPAGADSLAQKLYSVFGGLDISQVPTGYLAEYGVRLLELAHYAGTLTDTSLVDQSVSRYLRAQLASAHLAGPDTLPQVRAYNARMDAALAAAPGVIPLTMQCMAYATIRPDAVQQNLLMVQNEQVTDVPGRTQNPYQTRVLFTAAPVAAYAPTNTVTFLFRRNLFLTNCAAPVRSLALDFGDGRGYQAATWGQPLATTYPTGGTRRIKVKLVFETSLTSASTPGSTTPDTRESWFDLNVLGSSAAARTASVADLEQPFNSPTNAHSGGLASVIFGTTGGVKHTQLTKPFIISEGYSVYGIAPELRECNGANNDVDNFATNTGTAYTGNFDFYTKLLSAGYDIVYIDNNLGTDDILRNALLFEEVVRWVNQNKVGGTATGAQNVVMGQSMGGLVSRYGLAEMSKRGNDDPHTRLLILLDSPQRGANNPVGLQSLSRSTDTPIIGFPGLFEFSLADLTPKLTAGIRVLNQVGSQQLSIYNAVNGKGDIRPNTFIDGPYHQMVDYAASYPIVAVSDGSQCGRPQSTPAHVTLSNSDLNFFLRPLPVIGDFGISGELSAYGLPAAGQRDVVSRVRFSLDYNICIGYSFFRFCIPIHFNLINQSANSPANALPLETLPGGNSNPKAEAGPCGSVDYGSFPGLYAAYLRTNLYDGPICFVPTYSSLDVLTVTPATAYAKYINNATDNASPPRIPSYIANQNITGSDFNQSHIRFTARNSEWIYNEMQRPFNGNTNSLPCATECSVVSSIAGPTQVCTSPTSVFSVNTSQVTWSVTPSSYFTTSTGSGSQFVTSAAAGAQGSATITATFPCGPPVTKTVSVGSAYPTGQYRYNGSYYSLTGTHFIGYNNIVTIFLDQPYTFTFTSSDPNVALSTGGNSTSFSLPQSVGQVTITATATNASSDCGVSGGFIFAGTGYRYMVAPNPAASELTVSDGTDEPAASAAKADASATKSFQVDLYDTYGKKVKTRQSERGKAVLDVREVPNGLYNVRVGSGKDAYSEHVQITH